MWKGGGGGLSLAQLVEHWTGTANVMGLSFLGYLFATSSVNNCDGLIIFYSICHPHFEYTCFIILLYSCSFSFIHPSLI